MAVRPKLKGKSCFGCLDFFSLLCARCKCIKRAHARRTMCNIETSMRVWEVLDAVWRERCPRMCACAQLSQGKKTRTINKWKKSSLANAVLNIQSSFCFNILLVTFIITVFRSTQLYLYWNFLITHYNFSRSIIAVCVNFFHSKFFLSCIFAYAPIRWIFFFAQRRKNHTITYTTHACCQTDIHIENDIVRNKVPSLYSNCKHAHGGDERRRRRRKWNLNASSRWLIHLVLFLRPLHSAHMPRNNWRALSIRCFIGTIQSS